jgi:xanthine phosphoribosyltransferase
MSKKVFRSWQDFDEHIQILKHCILRSQWIPDYIVGVKRGGLIPAITLSHIFNKPFIMVSCQLRDSEDKEVKLYEMEELSKDKKILIVDDICDRGLTFQKIKDQLLIKNFSNIKTCSLMHNANQIFNVDYYAELIDRLTDDSWFVFPWEQ